MKLLDHLFPDRRSYVLWPLALTWMVTIAWYGWRFVSMGARGGIFGGILIAFSPIPVVLLLTRELPDKDQRRDLLDRQKKRLGKRLVGRATQGHERRAR